MVEISATAVKTLRELTGLPMMQCKKALVEAQGDQDQAIEVLKRDVGKVRSKLAGKPTEEGRIFTSVKDDGSQAVMVEIQCQSAPVASGEDITHLGEQLVKQLLQGPGAETPEQLLAQVAPDGGSKTLNELFDELVNRIREKIVITRVTCFPGPVAAYVHHDGKTGVLFQASGQNATAPILRDVAMHIAALNSTVVNAEDLQIALVEAERTRLADEAKATGKPDNIIEKIVDGRMKSFYVEEGVLILQPFVKDDSKTVSQALAEHGLEATGFVRWVIGN